MRLLLDLSAIKTGGGAQLASNFLDGIKQFPDLLNVECILASDSYPDKRRLADFGDVISVPGNAMRRVKFENLQLPRLLRARGITHSYTFFGPGLPRMSGLRQTVGVAYPILFYDDSSYWKLLGATDRFKRRLKNTARKRRLAAADHLIFETEVMCSRARASGLAHSHASIIQPTPTTYLYQSEPPRLGPYRVLFLSGTDPHKNLWRLPEVLTRLGPNDPDLRFMISVDRAAFLAMRSYSDREIQLIDQYIEFLGGLRPDDLQRAYDRVHALANISDLESFSNNYMESWLVGRPILASDRDFARSICGESAIYVEPHDPNSIVNGLRALAGGKVDLGYMIDEGKRRLAALPTMPERLQRIAEIIRGL